MDRIILHCDLNNFYASVECVLNPSLRNSPVAVAGDPEKRHGVIVAKNEIAKQYGIKTGDVIWEAKKKCPDIIIVPPSYDKYMDYSNRAFDIYMRFTSMVEPFGADECWLDCTASTKLFGDGKTIADTIRRVITEETGLTASVGVSFNKVFAKLGSDFKKPNATTVIDRENFRSLIWKLPTSELLGVGKHTAKKLAELNIFTIEQLALSDENILKNHLGILGPKLKKFASGEDDEKVREGIQIHKNESVGHGMTTMKDITDQEDARTLIYYLSEMVGSRMRNYGVKGYGIALTLRFADLNHITRRCTLNFPVCNSDEIAESCLNLLKEIWKFEPIRAITVSVFSLTRAGTEQLTFFNDAKRKKNENLDRAIDKIKQKYGSDKIRRANLIKTDFIYDKTDAEDFLPFKR